MPLDANEVASRYLIAGGHLVNFRAWLGDGYVDVIQGNFAVPSDQLDAAKLVTGDEILYVKAQP